MSSLIGKRFKPELGAHYWRSSVRTDDTKAGAVTDLARTKSPDGLEIVGVEQGAVLVRLPTGKFSYMALADGEIADPPPPPRKVTSIDRETWNAMHVSDPAAVAVLAAGTDWAPPRTLELHDVPGLRADLLRYQAAIDFDSAERSLSEYRASDEGRREIAQYAQARAHNASVREQEQAAAAAPAANPFAALFGDRR